MMLIVVPMVMIAIGTAPASAQTTDDPAADAARDTCPSDLNSIEASTTVVRFVKVAGLIDPPVRDYMLRELDKAEADPNTVGYMLWMNSNGSVLSDADYLSLAERLKDSTVETALWVGNTGSTAQGGSAELAAVVDLVGVTPDSTIGNTGSRRLPADWGDPFGPATERLESGTFTAVEAIEAGVSLGPLVNTVPIGSFATHLAGFDVVQCTDTDGALVTVPTTQPLLSGLPLTHQLFHTVASPEVAYLFFILGLGILVFELFVAGIGIAGIIGGGFLAMGSYGLAALPTNWWAIALLLIAMFFLGIDIQTNVPRSYTVAGLVCFVFGTLFVYSNGVSMSWVTMAAGVIGALLYAYTGMPSMVRTRFSTPTIGRTWMIGELGEAVTDVNPEGTVKVGDATWRAITNRATPVEKGESIRVMGIDRLILEIEPEAGGARDYRERSPKDAETASAD